MTAKTSAYKDFTPIMGVWRVTHLPSGRSLLGAAEHAQGRLNRTRFQLDAGVHPNKTLQQDWSSTTPEDFVFEIVDVLQIQAGQDVEADLAELLALWLEKLALPAEKLY